MLEAWHRNLAQAFATTAGVLLALTLNGCAALDRVGHADAIASAAGLTRDEIPTEEFLLTSYGRLTNPHTDIDVYIEGDGLAWITRTEPSLDPTPVQATGLRLAAADNEPNVVYLARPCQYTPMDKNPRCSVAYWTGRRFSPEVVSSMMQALDAIAARAPGQRLNLVGYSGGAAVAVLAASRRGDVATLRTVAGNLDVEYVNSIHGVASMPESLNPISVAAFVSNIPQIHIVSDADSVTPPEVAHRFVAATGERCAKEIVVSGIGHDADWEVRWASLRTLHPTCDALTQRRIAPDDLSHRP